LPIDLPIVAFLVLDVVPDHGLVTAMVLSF